MSTCERCGARLNEKNARADVPPGPWCPNRACGMCPDYRPALLAAVPDAEDERRAFIRMHASRIDAEIIAASAAGERQWAKGSILPGPAVWKLAMQLWDAKPDDC